MHISKHKTTLKTNNSKPYITQTITTNLNNHTKKESKQTQTATNYKKKNANSTAQITKQNVNKQTQIKHVVNK